MNSIEAKYQTESFIPNKNVINNLDSNEEILYQLKIFESYAEFEHHLYITNKKICIINYPVHQHQIIYNLNLNDLQGISFTKGIKYTKIEFISESINHYYSFDYRINLMKYHSYMFMVRENPQHIIKIIESIIWHYTNVNDRVDKLKNNEGVQIPNEFIGFLKNDRVFIPQKKSPEGIEFNQNLYLNYFKNEFKSNGKIIFKPSYRSTITVKYKYYNKSLKVLELMYFLLLFWKFKKDLLIPKEELLDLQEKLKPKEELSCFKCGAKLRSPYEFCSICGVKQKIFLNTEKKLLDLQKKLLKYEKKRYFDYNQKEPNQFNLIEKLYIQYGKYLNNEEKILLYYKSKLLNRFLLKILFFILVIMVFFFLMVFLSIIFFIFLLEIFIAVLIFLTIWFRDSFWSCLFTSQKIIFNKINAIYTTTYSNISSITDYNNEKDSEDIYFELNQPMESNHFKNKTSFALRFIPKNLNLYEKIVKLRDQFKNQ